jgi:polysaccharide deacetylase family protein (PEP-CTERM system associated)
MSEHSTVQNAFTVDLEDWFQGLTSTNAQPGRWPELESRVVPATERLLSLLREHEIRATFFVLGYVARQYPQLIESVVGDGHEIGVHGYWHRFVSRMTRDEFAAELDLALTAITAVTGTPPLGHRAPYFSINAATPWAFDVIASRGLRYDSSVFPTRNMLYGFPDAPRFPYRLEGTNLVEFPATTMRVLGRNWPVAGGFYNRALPYGIIKRGLAQVNGAGQPAVLYIHPWELDTGQVYDQVTPRERITHYHGRGRLEAKLRRLFADFQFGPLEDLLPAYETTPADSPERVKVAETS